MKQFCKKGISSFLVVVMMMSLFVGMPQTAFAATAAPDPAKDKVTASDLTPHVGDVVHLTAIGDRQDNDVDNIGVGSERYIATTWESSVASTDDKKFQPQDDYCDSSYTPKMAGSHTITVTFVKQTYDSQGDWVDTTTTDTKFLTLTVDATAGTADPAKNKVNPSLNGLNSDYPEFAIEVSGDRQFSPGTVTSEERYIPASFTYSDGTTNKTENLGANYKDFGLKNDFQITPPSTGSFTVTITFQKQTWDGANWNDVSGSTDTKTIRYDILGGDTSDGSLKVIMANGNMYVERYNGTESKFESQFYSNSSCFANVNGELYYIGNYYNLQGDYNKEATFSTQTVNGNTITSKWQAGALEVTQSITLATLTSQFVNLNYSLKNTGSAPITGLRFTKGADTYLSGGDEGAGMWKALSKTVGVTKTIGTGQQRMTLQGVTTPDSYTSQNFSRMDMEVVAGGPLSGTIDPRTETDNGYAMQWCNASLPAGETWNIEAIESFIVSPLSALGEARISDGTAVTLNFTIENKAGNKQDVTYSVTAPSGWTAVPARTGESIDPTSTVTLPVTVTPPSGVNKGDYRIVLNIEGNEEAQATGTISVLAIPKYTISSVVTPTTTNGVTLPQGIAFYNGTMYFTDSGTVKAMDASGNITIVAGIDGTDTQYKEVDDGKLATEATMKPNAIAFDSTGNMYIAEKDNQVVRMVDKDGKISTVFAAVTPTSPTSAAITLTGLEPVGIAFDSTGSIYVSGTKGIYKDPTSTADNRIYFKETAGMSADGNGNVYAAIPMNNIIKKFSSDGNSEIVAGGGSDAYTIDGGLAIDAELNNPTSVVVDEDGNLYIMDYGNHVIRYVDAVSGKIATIAGTGTAGFSGDGGPALLAQLKGSVWQGMALNSDKNVYFSDNFDTQGVIRKLALGYTVTYDSQGGSAVSDEKAKTGAKLSAPSAPTKSGFTFGGWYKDAACTNVWNFSTDTVTSNLTLYAKWTAQSSGGSGGGGSSAPANTGVVVLVNGTSYNVGTASQGTRGGQTLTTIAADETQLKAKMDEKGNGSTVTIPVNTKADIVVGELSGQIIKDMETKKDTLEIRTDNASYFLPASELKADAIAAQFGSNVKLSDIKFQAEIAKSAAGTVKVVENSAQKGNFSIVIAPNDFTVTATYGGKTVDINKFNIYVKRLVAIPDGVDPTKITTGVITEPDGTSRHVPTQVTKIDGKYYAEINSLTNSTYTVVWHPMEFTDVANHWAKSVVNDMGSRMVVSGVGNGLYEPDRDITRAEFAAIVVRALGLKPGEGSNNFTDVESGKWYCDYVKTATTYNIIAGYGNGKFGPNDKITRQDAMTMISRAMAITGLKAGLSNGDAQKLLAGFTDGGSASSYAVETIATCVKTGVVSGRGNNQVAPKAYITRAEVAAIVSRLLQKSDLIN